MSFSTDQKAEIIAQIQKSACCRRALLSGVLFSRGELTENGIIISVDSEVTAEFLSNLISEIYSKTAEVKTAAGRRRLVCFSSKSAESYLNSLSDGAQPFAEKCQMCRSAFLRGMFLASGRISDPIKQYLLEFSLRGDPLDRAFRFFEEIGLEPRISAKKNESVIYFKNSNTLEDFFALAGMNQLAFILMNAKIQRELRNSANRIANCETNNITKAINASQSQIAILRELDAKGLMSQLPDELEKTARLRMEHDDLSLSQLAALMTPRVSKPGLSHRLKRITEIATSLLDRSKKH